MVFDVNVLPSSLTILGVVASFFVALVAVGLGWHANRQLHKIRRLEKQEYLVNKIIDWAEGITVFISKQIVSDRTNAAIILNNAADRLKELNVLAAKGQYIESLVSGIFSDNAVLLADIKKFRKRINQHTAIITLILKVADNNRGELMKILIKRLGAEETYAVKVRDDALELIRFVARIYTKIK